MCVLLYKFSEVERFESTNRKKIAGGNMEREIR
jgi:hypothetical protein